MATTLQVSEKALLTFNVSSSSVDTSGKTVYLYLVDSAGTATQIGSTVGLAAGSTISIQGDLATSGIAANSLYEVEVVADPTGDNPVTLIPNTTTGYPVRLAIHNVKGIA